MENESGLPYAEDVNYWKTGASSPESWISKAVKLIEDVGGTVHEEGFGRSGGHAAYMLGFEIDGHDFKIHWPVLESRGGEEAAARRQAATMLHHDVKAKCMVSKVKTPRVAFFEYLLLPNGQVLGQMASPQLAAAIPKLLTRGQ